MKFLLKFLLFLLVALLVAMVLAKSTIAEAPTIQSEDYYSEDIIIKDNAITISNNQLVPARSSSPVTNGTYSGRHSTRAERFIDVQSLQNYLSDRHSPLAGHSAQILQSSYWSTIIGICTIEQYGCTRAPYNNYWGIMEKGSLRRFSTLNEGIQAISNLLATYEAKGKDTIEELNGYYVVPASSNWLKTVLRTKQEVESLWSFPTL